MVSSVHHNIRLAAAILLLSVLISSIAFGIARTIHLSNTAKHENRCSLYAVALASTSQAWLQTEKSTHEQFRYPLLALGVVYLRVVIEDELVMDLRRASYATATLPPSAQDSIADTRIVRHADQCAVDVVVPHMLANPNDPEEPGTLRILQFGINAPQLLGENRRVSIQVAAISAVVWVMATGLVGLGSRHLQRKGRLPSDHPTIIPVAARQLASGNLMLLPDELLFKVDETGIDLTPKQAALLRLLISEPGRAFADAEILKHVWKASPYANSSDVKQQIYLIRKRLRCAGLDASAILATVAGVGYKLRVTKDEGWIDATSTDSLP